MSGSRRRAARALTTLVLLIVACPTVGASSTTNDATDIDVTLIERTPRYDFDAAKNNPEVGDVVTFTGHIIGWGSATVPAVGYQWLIDGNVVESGTLTGLGGGEERTVTRTWTWVDGNHTVKLVADPAGLVTELSEVNNAIEDRINGISAGFWVEQSVVEYFHEHQFELGIGSNSWQDWIQRQMRSHNQLCADAIWPNTPQGVLDRVRIDKIVVVPDGALPLNGGLPTNHPDTSDKTVDLEWGFPATQLPPGSSFYEDHTSLAEDNPFHLEPSLVHELAHARYLIDSYGFDVANNGAYGGYDQVQIWEGDVFVAGSAYMPFLAWDVVLYYNESGGVMTGPYGFHWSPYEAGAFNRIAGRRATCGNVNASCNIGEYLEDLPANNHVRFVDPLDRPYANANVRIYRAAGAPDWYGKTFDNTPDAEYTTDANGYAHLPRNPFTGGDPIEHTYGLANGVMILRIEQAGQVWYRFMEVSAFNLQYWAGNTVDASYVFTLPGTPASPVPVPVGAGPSLAVLGVGGGRARLQVTLGQADETRVKIYNARGQCVRDLFNGRLEPGANVLEWDGRDGGGRDAASGVYFARAVTAGREMTGKVTLVR
jgi:plastocyanin